jgi:hypothetical protein
VKQDLASPGHKLPVRRERKSGKVRRAGLDRLDPSSPPPRQTERARFPTRIDRRTSSSLASVDLQLPPHPARGHSCRGEAGRSAEQRGGRARLRGEAAIAAHTFDREAPFKPSRTTWGFPVEPGRPRRPRRLQIRRSANDIPFSARRLPLYSGCISFSKARGHTFNSPAAKVRSQAPSSRGSSNSQRTASAGLEGECCNLYSAKVPSELLNGPASSVILKSKLIWSRGASWDKEQRGNSWRI